MHTLQQLHGGSDSSRKMCIGTADLQLDSSLQAVIPAVDVEQGLATSPKVEAE